MIIIGVRFHEETPDPYDLQTFDLCFFLGSTFLVTVHDGPSAAIDDVAKRIEKNPDLLSRGVDRLSHSIMDGAVDAYFPLLDKIDEFVDSLEQRVIIEFDRARCPRFSPSSDWCCRCAGTSAPEREVFNMLTNRPSQLLSPESQIYFRDIYDHVLRINDSIETYRELAEQRVGQLSHAGLESPWAGHQGTVGHRHPQHPVRGDQRHVGDEFRAHSPFGAIRMHFGGCSAFSSAIGVVLLLILRFWKLL